MLLFTDNIDVGEKKTISDFVKIDVVFFVKTTSIFKQPMLALIPSHR